tara:strand:+ start:822 stop:2675 length:1854 start_codon:yes stop_codon:yes gene_type:complete
MANAHDMVYILSKDYWGFDPSTRDDSLNFYTNVWTLPKTQYDSMSDEDDRRKLYRCALFYVVDKTDNHGFTPIAIQSQGNTVIVAATAAGGGINRRRYDGGGDAGYETGSIVMRQADANATTFEELQDMKTSVPGKFEVDEFIFDDETAIKSKVEELQDELGQINAADTGSYAAEVSGSPADVALDASEPLAANPTTEAASGTDLITDVQDTSLNLFAEMETANLPNSNLPGIPVVPNTMGEDSSLSGNGVPEWYGADEDAPSMTAADKLAMKRKRNLESKMRGINRKNARKSKMEMMSAEQTANLTYSSLPGIPVVPNTMGEDSSLGSHGVPEWYGSAEQGYDDKMDESLGERHSGSHKQSMKDRRDEAAAMDKKHTSMHRKYDDVMTMDAEMADQETDMTQLMTSNAYGQAGVRYDHEIHYRADELAAEDFPGLAAANEQTANLTYSTLPGIPVVPNDYGEDSSLSGHGVPEYYGAEGRKYGKRQRFGNRYLARDAKGRWISNVGVSGSIKQDLRSNAKSQQPVGFRGLGDADTRRAEASPSVVDAAEPMDYIPYEFVDEMDTGDYISSDDFMTLLADTVDGMALRYKPPMYKSPIAMASAGAILAIVGMKLLKK